MTPFEEAEQEMRWSSKGSLEPFGRLWKRGYCPTEDELQRFNAWVINRGRPDPLKEKKRTALSIYRARRDEVRRLGLEESADESKRWTAIRLLGLDDSIEHDELTEIRIADETDNVCKWISKPERLR
jgi:hypothetical protein